eukprot:7677571-Alexandrium_andersonii.AAC.1
MRAPSAPQARPQRAPSAPQARPKRTPSAPQAPRAQAPVTSVRAVVRAREHNTRNASFRGLEDHLWGRTLVRGVQALSA